jgi:hypothetical protein
MGEEHGKARNRFEGLTPEERSARSRIAALQRWSKEDATEGTAKAKAGFAAKFEKQVDPDMQLDPVERGKRADRALRAHMTSLALKSAKKRRAG